jgi:hypothetical protein
MLLDPTLWGFGLGQQLQLKPACIRVIQLSNGVSISAVTEFVVDVVGVEAWSYVWSKFQAVTDWV